VKAKPWIGAARSFLTSKAQRGGALATQANFAALPGTGDVIRRFNRDTWWLATGVLGGVIFAALVIVIQECQPKATEAERDLLLNANPATLASVVAKSSSSNGKMTAGPGSSLDNAFTEIPPPENPSSQMEAPASNPTPLHEFSSEIDQHDMQANAGSWTPAHRQESGRVTERRLHHASSRSRPRFVDVKMRLIELWHQSLAKTEKNRNILKYFESRKQM
jgi:hypothetical protein